MTKSSPLLLRCLYRNLLRAVKPFSSPSPNGRVLNSLLHRTGIDDHIDDWKAYVSKSTDPVQTRQERARDLTYSYSERISDEGKENATPPPNRTQQILFRRLLREVVAGPEYGFQKMIFPSQVDTNRLREVVRREFRNTPESISLHFNFDSFTREQVAWTALRELNKKLSYFDDLLQSSPTPLLPQQAASNVSPLPFSPPSSYLRPGSFLVSHPHMMDCFFGKTVICILDHKTVSNETNNADPSIENDEDSSDDDIKSIPGQATYGLIINRISVNPETQENKTLKEVFEEEMLPSKLADVFGSDSIVREGGPVPEPIQIVYSVAADNTDEDSLAAAVGGKLIPGIPDSDDSSTSIYSDRATYFKGNLMKAMVAVDKGSLDRGMYSIAR